MKNKYFCTNNLIFDYGMGNFLFMERTIENKDFTIKMGNFLFVEWVVFYLWMGNFAYTDE